MSHGLATTNARAILCLGLSATLCAAQPPAWTRRALDDTERARVLEQIGAVERDRLAFALRWAEGPTLIAHRNDVRVRGDVVTRALGGNDGDGTSVADMARALAAGAARRDGRGFDTTDHPVLGVHRRATGFVDSPPGEVRVLDVGTWTLHGATLVYVMQASADKEGADRPTLDARDRCDHALARLLRAARRTMGAAAPLEYDERPAFARAGRNAPWRDAARAALAPRRVPVLVASPGPGQVVADIGCGHGGDVRAMAPLVGPTGTVHARDIDARGIASLVGLTRVDAAVSTEGDVRIPANTVDVGTMSDVMHYVLRQDRRRDFARSVHRALAPGGVFLVIQSARRGGQREPSIDLRKTYDLFEDAGFESGTRWRLWDDRGTHAAFVIEFRKPPRALTARERDRRGDAHLLAGRFARAIDDFDAFLEAHPDVDPHHWRRGIALYYAGRYRDGVAQFERHRLVNPDDVENAVWHFLCKAKADGIDAARAALLPVGPDPRPPMVTVYELFAGRATPADVEKRAEAAGPRRDALASARFYAHLYLGLYHDVCGDAERARHHIGLASGAFTMPHYMGDIARVHARLLRR